jgi:hypothetical protein
VTRAGYSDVDNNYSSAAAGTAAAVCPFSKMAQEQQIQAGRVMNNSTNDGDGDERAGEAEDASNDRTSSLPHLTNADVVAVAGVCVVAGAVTGAVTDNNQPAQSDIHPKIEAETPPSSMSMSYGTIQGNQLQQIFPFHIVVDKEFRIRQIGARIRRFASGLVLGDSIGNWFKLCTPDISGDTSSVWDWTKLVCYKDSVFELESLAWTAEIGALTTLAEPIRPFRLSGGMYITYDDANGDIFSASFLLNPSLDSIEDMRYYDVSFSDFPKHSMQRTLVYLSEHLKSETFLGEKSRTDAMNAQVLLDMKRTFVRYMSHEIRTPLNTVSMGLKLIQDMKSSRASDDSSLRVVQEEEDVFDMADEIKESCDIAINILNDLLMYEKMEGGLMVLEKKREPALSLVFEVNANQLGVTNNYCVYIVFLVHHIDSHRLHTDEQT